MQTAPPVCCRRVAILSHNIRTARRRLMRVARHRESQATPKTAGGKRRVGEESAEEGELSDTGASVASSSVSKVARQVRNGFDIR